MARTQFAWHGARQLFKNAAHHNLASFHLAIAQLLLGFSLRSFQAPFTLLEF